MKKLALGILIAVALVTIIGTFGEWFEDMRAKAAAKPCSEEARAVNLCEGR